MLLILVGFGISPLVYSQLRATPNAEVPSPPDSMAVAELQQIVQQPAFAMPPAESFGAILARPLFNFDRRPGVEPEEPKEPEKPKTITPAARLAVKLKGTIVDGSERTAILVDPRKKAIIGLRKNGEFQGWTLSDVGQEEVTFTRGGIERRLMLKYGDMPPGRGSKRPGQGKAQQKGTAQQN
jgi:hypothetical protein